MATNYWEELPESTGEYVQSNSSDPIPAGTEVQVSITEAKWHSFQGSEHKNINLTWQVDEPEEYHGKRFYQNVKVNGDDPVSSFYKQEKQEKTRSEARLALSVIDKYSGGNIFALKREVTTPELQKFLVGARMTVEVDVYKNKNTVKRISAPKGEITAPSKQDVNAARAMPKKPPVNDIDDDLIPF